MYYSEKDRKKYADHIWMFLIFSGWIISNLQEYLSEPFAVRTYFLLLSVAICLVATNFRKVSFFSFAFWELSIYNVFDEVFNTADSSQWHELPILFAVIIHSWYKFKK